MEVNLNYFYGKETCGLHESVWDTVKIRFHSLTNQNAWALGTENIIIPHKSNMTS